MMTMMMPFNKNRILIKKLDLQTGYTYKIVQELPSKHCN